MKTLVLGGYGNFGARICRGLAGNANISLVIAGRDGVKAAALANELQADYLQLDIATAGLSQRLREQQIDLIIHAAGPFQNQGYQVARAAAEAGSHYIDLADGRRFVCDFPQALHAGFLQAGKAAITGASTVPALSSAVIDHLTAGWEKIDVIDFCIAPAQTAPRGVATMEAVLQYCGAPIKVWQRGRWETRYGWSDPEFVHFLRLRPRLAALCDIPDLELLPQRYPGTQSVMFRAALEISMTQRALALLAALRRKGVIGRPDRLAKLLNATAKLLDPLGSSLGGMVVRVSGVDADGCFVRRAWHIAADYDHGPEIPCMAAILLARKLASALFIQPGAYACMGLLSLSDFLPEFNQWKMVTDVVEEHASHETQTV